MSRCYFYRGGRAGAILLALLLPTLLSAPAAALSGDAPCVNSLTERVETLAQILKLTNERVDIMAQTVNLTVKGTRELSETDSLLARSLDLTDKIAVKRFAILLRKTEALADRLAALEAKVDVINAAAARARARGSQRATTSGRRFNFTRGAAAV